MKKFIIPEVKAIKIESSIVCHSIQSGETGASGFVNHEAQNGVELGAAQRGIFD